MVGPPASLPPPSGVLDPTQPYLIGPSVLPEHRVKIREQRLIKTIQYTLEHTEANADAEGKAEGNITGGSECTRCKALEDTLLAYLRSPERNPELKPGELQTFMIHHGVEGEVLNPMFTDLVVAQCAGGEWTISRIPHGEQFLLSGGKLSGGKLPSPGWGWGWGCIVQ